MTVKEQNRQREARKHVIIKSSVLQSDPVSTLSGGRRERKERKKKNTGVLSFGNVRREGKTSNEGVNYNYMNGTCVFVLWVGGGSRNRGMCVCVCDVSIIVLGFSVCERERETEREREKLAGPKPSVPPLLRVVIKAI